MSDQITDNVPQVKSAFDAACIRALTAIGIQAEGYAKLELENNPRRIDTGYLRNSITNRVAAGEKAVYIGTATSYAVYVHEGTDRMAPNRFLKNAVEKNKDQYKQIAESMLKQSI